MSEQKLQVGVLVSGRGTNLQSLIEASTGSQTKFQIAVVISNQPQALALTRARQAGIPADVIPAVKGETRESYEKKIEDTLNRHGVQLVVLAGFMRLVSPYLISRFKNRIINIHPALLPSFPGLDAQKQALEYGVRYSGCSVHLVDAGCDTGPVILQSVVPVMSNDTVESLSERILKEEHQLLPKAIDLFAQNKVRIVGRRVEILEDIK